jgi:predicted permease
MEWRRLLWTMATNPLILPCLAAIAMRSMPFGLYEPINQTLQLAGQAALGLALLAIGASLRLSELLRRRLALVLPVALKLLAFPLVLIAIALAIGVRGDDLVYLTLITAVPTATNGYLLARQLGGDAELYAAVTTLQTVVSFFSIPAMLGLAAQFGGG